MIPSSRYHFAMIPSSRYHFAMIPSSRLTMVVLWMLRGLLCCNIWLFYLKNVESFAWEPVTKLPGDLSKFRNQFCRILATMHENRQKYDRSEDEVNKEMLNYPAASAIIKKYNGSAQECFRSAMERDYECLVSIPGEPEKCSHL